MRLGFALTVLIVVLAGCSGPGEDAATDDVATTADAPAADAPKLDAMGMPVQEGAGTVNETIDHDGTFRPNVCAAGSCAIGGLGVRFFSEHVGQALQSGTLHVEATPQSPTEELIIVVSVQSGCPDDCALAQELARAEGRGPFDLEVPAADLGPEDVILVRITPAAPLAAAFTTAGWTVHLAGTLTFLA